MEISYKNLKEYPEDMPPVVINYKESIFNKNPKSTAVNDIKRHLLIIMYYDKWFQLDPHFPLIVFNHEQIKESTTAGYLLAEKPKFEQISKRLMKVNVEVLGDLIKRMEDGERVKPESDEKKLCFQLIKDLDHIGGFVKGSATTKKYMRNEIWSLYFIYKCTFLVCYLFSSWC